LFASTNHRAALDKALLRPGRFDVHVPFTYAKRDEAVAIFKHFYARNELESGSEEAKNIESKLDLAAETFADAAIQADAKVTVAHIQVFLLRYKKDPAMALQKVNKWIDHIRKGQNARAVIVAPKKK
jgi:ATP-dependent 26S proteasome regulatory subunit